MQCIVNQRLQKEILCSVPSLSWPKICAVYLHLTNLKLYQRIYEKVFKLLITEYSWARKCSPKLKVKPTIKFVSKISHLHSRGDVHNDETGSSIKTHLDERVNFQYISHWLNINITLVIKFYSTYIRYRYFFSQNIWGSLNWETVR